LIAIDIAIDIDIQIAIDIAIEIAIENGKTTKEKNVSTCEADKKSNSKRKERVNM
jgi:hypothetical protein